MAADFGAAAAWMRDPATLALAAGVCADLGVAERPRVVLALLMMAADGGGGALEADRDADAVMRREAARFDRALRAALGGGAAARAAIAADAARAGRFYRAWLAQDRPHTLRHLMAAVVASNARQRRAGVAAPAPPEETLAEIRRMAGAEAEAEARRRFDGAWEAVEGGAAPRAGGRRRGAARPLGRRRRARGGGRRRAPPRADRRARARPPRPRRARAARGGRPRRQVQRGVDPRARAAGALDAAALAGLMDYVAERIAAWEAPVDREETAAWRAAAAARLAAAAAPPPGGGAADDAEAARRALMERAVVLCARGARARRPHLAARARPRRGARRGARRRPERRRK